MDKDFSNSKIKEICFHGTDSEPFKELDKDMIQKNPEDGDPGYFGWGFYLTTDLAYAQEFGTTVLKFKVNIQNPFPFDDVDYSAFVRFIFDDCEDKLDEHLHDTMYFFNLIGKDTQLDYSNDNTDDVIAKCSKVAEKYGKKESFTDDERNEIASLMTELAENINNWLNGLFFYFGREVFHYITMNGYDGVIVMDGKEIVVYETEQLNPVQDEQLVIYEGVGKLTKGQLLNDLVKEFGLVDLDNLPDAFYILQDGRLLDTKGKFEKHQHGNISKYIEDKYKIKDALEENRSKFMNSIGAIKVTPWIPGIIVTSMKMSEEQEDALYSVIKLLSTKINSEHPLMILSEDGLQFIDYDDIENPEEVITAILGYQILGRLKEKLSPGCEMKLLNNLN